MTRLGSPLARLPEGQSDSYPSAGAEGPRPTQGIHMHIFETFNGFTVLILLLLAGAWLALLAYEGKL